MRIVAKWQFHHGGRLVADPEPRYDGGKDVGVFHNDIDCVTVIYFDRISKELGYDKVDGYACEVNKNGFWYLIKNDVDLAELFGKVKNGDEVNVYIVHVSPEANVTECLNDRESGGENVVPNLGSAVNNAISGVCSSGTKSKARKGKEKASDRVLVGVSDRGKNIREEASSVRKNDADLEEDLGVNVGLEGEEGVELEWESSESEESLYDEDEEFGIDSENDEELRVAREELRIEKFNKKKRYVRKYDNAPIGKAGAYRGFDNVGLDQENRHAGEVGGSEEIFDSDELGSEGSEEERDGSDEDALAPRTQNRRVYYDPTSTVVLFETGMIFESVYQFREAVRNYAVQRGVDVKFSINDKRRVRVICKQGCDWVIHASVDTRSNDFMIKTYWPFHKCYRSNRNKHCNTAFIVRRYNDRIISQPSIYLWQMQEMIKEDHGIYVGKTICRLAKLKILGKFMGDYNEEYARLLDYAEMIRETNPGSTCIVKMDSKSEPGKNLFVGFYLCLNALKKGWIEGCRNLIGFDDSFLKGIVKGQILSAISKDGNDQMYPVAWAMVRTETKESWSWFIRLVQYDLCLANGDGITVTSDMQKGLVPAIEDLLPLAEHRMCARHIWSNWKKKWRGEERRKMFWACAKASFQIQLKDRLQELSKLGAGICEDLLSYNKEMWCRAYFNTQVKADTVDNNMCEAFNGWIMVARHKSIITMLEEIRHKIMKMITDMRRFADSWITDISPKAMKTFTDNRDRATKCRLTWNGDVGFEVVEGEYGHTVDLTGKSCTCRSWQLKGIPCPHAIAAMHHLDIAAEDHICHWYRKTTYMKAYSHFIQPIPNMKMWPETSTEAIVPPPTKKMPGRPKKCRKKAPESPKHKFGKLSRRGRVMVCTICHQSGHNRRGCKDKATVCSDANLTADVQEAHNEKSMNEMPTNDLQQHKSSRTTSRGRKRKSVEAKRIYVGDDPLRSQAHYSHQPKSRKGGYHAVKPAADSATKKGSSTNECQLYPVEIPSNVDTSSRDRGSARGRGRGIGTGRSIPTTPVHYSKEVYGHGLVYGDNGDLLERRGHKETLVSSSRLVQKATNYNIELGFKPHKTKFRRNSNTQP